jgi:hypothetical protein
MGAPATPSGAYRVGKYFSKQPKVRRQHLSFDLQQDSAPAAVPVLADGGGQAALADRYQVQGKVEADDAENGKREEQESKSQKSGGREAQGMGGERVQERIR